jgi:hypothetical protein
MGQMNLHSSFLMLSNSADLGLGLPGKMQHRHLARGQLNAVCAPPI